MQPAAERGGQTIALGQMQRTLLDARGQVAPGGAGQAVGFQVFQGAGVFFTQAHGFGQPKSVQRVQCSHAPSCRVDEVGA